MAVVSKLTSIGKAGNRQMRRSITLTLSGVYAAGGQVVDLTALTNPSGFDGGKQFGRVPESVIVANGPIAYQFQWVPGATLGTGKLKIWDEVAAAELANGAYPAALTGADAITLELISKQLV